MTIAGAFFYLTACTIKNGLRVRLRRLRQPRYLIVTLVGALYFFNYVVLFRGVRSEPGGDTRVSLGELAARFGVSLELIGTLLIVLIVSVSWLMSGRRPALDFSRADVQFLFTAPVTRRQLLHYKLLRSQIGALLGSLFFALVLRPGGSSSAVGRFWIGLWIVAIAIELHLIGSTLVHNSLAAHGGSGWSRQRTPLLVIATVIAALIWTIVPAWPALSAMTSAREVFAELERLTSTGVAGVVLWPFNALARLPLATSLAEFVRALPWAALIIALNYVWVLRADTAFEEASAEHAEIRAEHAARPTAIGDTEERRAPFKLAASGPPETALLWKNLILLSRQTTLNVILILIPIVAITAGFLATDARRAGIAAVMALLCLAFAVLLVLTGPFSMRNDLRHDLANLPLLKTWPVRGATLVRGAVLAPTVALSAMVMLLIVLAAVLFGYVPASRRGAILILDRFVYAGVAILLAPALVLVQIVIQNAFAVLFPAWVTIGPSRGRGGIEAMGQQMLLLFGGLFLLALTLVPAAIVTTVAGFAIYALTGTVALLPCAAVATVVIVVECWIATEVLGAVLDRTDVGAIDAPAG